MVGLGGLSATVTTLVASSAAVAAPYVAAGVALLIGLLSAGLSARSTRRTLAEQRALAREDRLWERRAETYIDLLQWTEQTSQAAREAQGREKDRLTEDEWLALAQMPTALSARVEAFGSDEVVSEVTDLRVRVYKAREDVSEGSNPLAPTTEELRLVLDLRMLLNQLTATVRQELQPEN